ncbi:MAG TPA: DUF6660 family protein [Bacteroidales bacterium]|nr:DUF6660 family protein [Bacteroidales bacterium]
MKVLCLLFSLYVIYMVSLPCIDKELKCDHFAHSAQSTNHSDENQKDSCSPFCVCSCCNVQVVLSDFYFYNQPPLEFQVLKLTLASGAERLFPAIIWQPPKLG